MTMTNCPECNGEYTYMDGHLYVCPTCFFEWTEESMREAQEALIVRDLNGNEIKDGDDALIAQDLKLGKDTIKQGTKVKALQILDSTVDGHDLQGKVDGFGNLYLKSSVIKK